MGTVTTSCDMINYKFSPEQKPYRAGWLCDNGGMQVAGPGIFSLLMPAITLLS